jgi:hypothetical protein
MGAPEPCADYSECWARSHLAPAVTGGVDAGGASGKSGCAVDPCRKDRTVRRTRTSDLSVG